MHPVQEAANDPERLKRDFIVREQQMANDMRNIQIALNGVWKKPIAELCSLLYYKRNPALLRR
jgi:hypothetical protein